MCHLDDVCEASALEGVQGLVQALRQPPRQLLHLVVVPFLNEEKGKLMLELMVPILRNIFYEAAHFTFFYSYKY